MKDIFLPPGVQVSMFERFGSFPSKAEDGVASKIEGLWAVRNTAPESEIEGIDRQMEDLAREAHFAMAPKTEFD